MKFGEHEYKVMGLAPYAPEPARGARGGGAARASSISRKGGPRAFAGARPGERYQLLLRATLGLRFDAVAGGAQRLLEDVLLRWARLMRERYGGERLALGGGVFMNVKANMLHRRRGVGARSSSPSRRAATSRTRWARPTSATCRSARAAGVPPTPAPFGPAYLGPSR